MTGMWHMDSIVFWWTGRHTASTHLLQILYTHSRVTTQSYWNANMRTETVSILRTEYTWFFYFNNFINNSFVKIFISKNRFYIIMFYIIMFYIIMFYIIMFYIMFYTIMFYTIMFYIIMFYIIMFYIIMFYIIMFYIIMFYIIMFYIIMFYIIFPLF